MLDAWSKAGAVDEWMDGWMGRGRVDGEVGCYSEGQRATVRAVRAAKCTGERAGAWKGRRTCKQAWTTRGDGKIGRRGSEDSEGLEGGRGMAERQAGGKTRWRRRGKAWRWAPRPRPSPPAPRTQEHRGQRRQRRAPAPPHPAAPPPPASPGSLLRPRRLLSAASASSAPGLSPAPAPLGVSPGLRGRRGSARAPLGLLGNALSRSSSKDTSPARSSPAQQQGPDPGDGPASQSCLRAQGLPAAAAGFLRMAGRRLSASLPSAASLHSRHSA